VLISALWYPATGCVEMVQSCAEGSSDLTFGSISLPRGWSNIATSFLERRLRPHACQSLKKKHLDNALNNLL